MVYIQALPQHDPIINGLAPNYAIGDFLMANCTSDRSSIPATLVWYIDEEKVGQLVYEIYIFFIFYMCLQPTLNTKAVTINSIKMLLYLN